MKLPPIPPGHVVTLINAVKPASLAAKNANLPAEASLDLAIKQNVIEQLGLLRDLEPVLSRKFGSGDVLIVGAVYNLQSGRVDFIEQTITSFPKFSIVNN